VYPKVQPLEDGRNRSLASSIREELCDPASGTSLFFAGAKAVAERPFATDWAGLAEGVEELASDQQGDGVLLFSSGGSPARLGRSDGTRPSTGFLVVFRHILSGRQPRCTAQVGEVWSVVERSCGWLSADYGKSEEHVEQVAPCLPRRFFVATYPTRGSGRRAPGPRTLKQARASCQSVNGAERNECRLILKTLRKRRSALATRDFW
jgi:hypothetical protein